MVSTRLWLGGVVQMSRDRSLADRLMQQVRRCAACLRPLLVLTDGWSAYPNSIRRAFREKVKLTKGVGRACLQVWPELHIGTVIKRTEKKRVVEITRKIAHGLLEQAEKLLHSSRGGIVLNTAFIERLNGTFRERLASLTRKSRHAARRLKALEMGMYLEYDNDSSIFGPFAPLIHLMLLIIKGTSLSVTCPLSGSRSLPDPHRLIIAP